MPSQTRNRSGWLAWMTRPVDAAWLSTFRIILGLLLAVSMGRFLAYGWVDGLLVKPTFHFKYWGFEWVEPLPGPAMHAPLSLQTGLSTGQSASPSHCALPRTTT